jgi:hypothetical protein
VVAVLPALVFAVSTLRELVGVALVVRVPLRPGRSSEEFRSLNPEGRRKGSHARASATSGLVEQIPCDQALARWAVAAPLGGIVMGLVGNLLLPTRLVVVLGAEG